MSEEKSVLVPVLIGCGLVGVLFLLVCGGGLMFFIPRAMNQAEQMMEQFTEEMVKQQALQNLPDDWQAPAEDIVADDLFPEAVGGFTLRDHDEDAEVSQFGLVGVPGRHARYETVLTNIDVYAYQVSDNDRDAQLEQIEQTINDDFTTRVHSSFSRGNSQGLSFHVSPPDTSGWVWASQGWMFLFLSDDAGVSATFPGDYLNAIQPIEESITPDESDTPEENSTPDENITSEESEPANLPPAD